MRTISWILCAVLMHANLTIELVASDRIEVKNSHEDAYDRITTLVDSIRSWSKDSIASKQVDKIKADILPDTLNLMDYFPGSSITADDSTSVMTIVLPTHMDIVNTKLKFSVGVDSGDIQRSIKWLSPIEVIGDSVWLDNFVSAQLNHVAHNHELRKLISNRLIQLRTAALTEVMKPHYTAVRLPDVSLTIRSRDTISMTIAHQNFTDVLNHISTDKLIYAGVLDVSVTLNQATVKYYILMTSTGARGHHFMEWTENIIKDGKTWEAISISVIFTPYVRTDNLKSLFNK